MIHVHRRALFPVTAALLLAACSSSSAADTGGFPSSPIATVQSQGGNLRVAAFTAPEQPPTRGTITVKLAITDASGNPTEGLVIQMAPEMPAMGHGTPVVPRITAKGGGVYLAEDVNLFMAGRWDLRMTMTGAVDDDAIVSVDVR